MPPHGPAGPAPWQALAITSQNRRVPALIPRERRILEHVRITNIILIRGEVTQREAVRIWEMIVDLDTAPFSCSIANITTEEERTGISDRSDVAYPILARMLATGRDNLKDTIAALEQ